METLFGKRKSRPRQSSVNGQALDELSVPYDRTMPARSPIPVGTVSQVLRGSTSPLISAPFTNPTLTSDGMEFNKDKSGHKKNERDAYSNGQLPDNSARTTLSSTYLNSQSNHSSWSTSPASTSSYISPKDTSPHTSYLADARNTSTTVTDFGQYPSSSHRTSGRKSPIPQTTKYRPSSVATTRSDHYTPSIEGSLAAESILSHLPVINHHRQSSIDEFHFPRPETDEEIEVLFQRVRARLGIHDATNITIEQKWQIVHQDEQAKFREQRKKKNDLRKQAVTGQPSINVITKDTPEWYLKKFMDSTITPKHVQSLAVSLRTLPIASVNSV